MFTFDRYFIYLRADSVVGVAGILAGWHFGLGIPWWIAPLYVLMQYDIRVRLFRPGGRAKLQLDSQALLARRAKQIAVAQTLNQLEAPIDETGNVKKDNLN